jgi:hypothetical protein
MAMDPQQWLAAALLGLGGMLALLNWLMLVASLLTGRFHSCIPPLGAMFLALGALLHPVLRPYFWAAILLDYGTLGLAIASPWLIRQWWQTSRFNLLEEYVARRDRTTVHLRLFRRDIFTLQWEIRRPPGEYGLVGMGQIGTWEREAETVVLRIGSASAVLREAADGGRLVWCESSEFGRHPDSPELSLAGLEFVSRT